MGFLRLQNAFTREGGLPEDVIVNTMHFLTDGIIDDPLVAEIATAVDAFYGEIQVYLSELITGAYVQKGYDLEEPPPRVPVNTINSTITTASGALFPAELAICLSFRGDYESGTPNARKRGRIFLGPLDGGVATGSGASDLRIDTAVLTDIGGAAADLRDAVIALGHAWCVYSPTTDATETLADAFFPITQGWIDNAFDVQRRRGADATVREVWS